MSWFAAWQIARRDLSLRFKGLRLMVVCLMLGVGALTAIGSLTTTISRELASRGALILGGDLEISVWQREFTVQERAALARYGALSDGRRMQAIAVVGAVTGGTTSPVALKAVDDNWPLVGRLRLADGRLVGAPAAGTAWISSDAANRLRVNAGDQIAIGGQALKIGGIIAEEPDRLSEGFALGPAVITDQTMPQNAGMTAPGAMYRSKLRLRCAGPCDPAALAAQIKAQFPSAGLTFKTRDNAAPGAENFIGRMGDFLVLVSLAALAIAGIGIGGGVASFLEARRGAIATYKVLGADSSAIIRIYGLQVAVTALAGCLAGVVIGLAVMPLLTRALSGLLPISAGMAFSPGAVGLAVADGLLVALIFAAPPLIRARHFPAMALMRARVAPLAGMLREVAWPVGIGVVLLLALVLLNAADLRLTLLFIAGITAIFALLTGLGWIVRTAAARLPRPSNPLLRMGLGNLHRPGAPIMALVIALGFGLSSFVLLATVQSALDANIAARVPARAPDYFVMDVPKDRVAAFAKTVEAAAPGASLRTIPAMRGAILAYGPADHPIRVADLAEIPEQAWALKGERGLTYADQVPEGNALTAGAWWPTPYTGPPLVSVDEKLGQQLGLKLGDVITIGVLGVERTARIASFRRIDWDSMGFNYVLVFSPNMLSDAPHTYAATINLPPTMRDHGKLLQALVHDFPASSPIEVGPMLKQARDLLGQVSMAILAAASVAVLAGMAVLIGAIAAARARQTYDTVMLRVLGASRGQVLLMILAEYGALALLLAGVALVLGGGIGWLVIVQLFKFAWLPDWRWVATVLGAGLGLVMAIALGGSLALLRTRPAAALRQL